MPKSPASSRAFRKVDLTASTPEGLRINLPVEVYGGTVSDHGITKHQYVTVTVPKGDGEDDTTEDHPVGTKPYDKVTGEDVERDAIIKKIDTEYGEVFVDDHEIEQLFELQPDSLAVKTFQPLHLFHQGTYVPKSLYYVAAQKGKKGSKSVPSPENQRALAAFLKALREEGAMAVCELTTRGIPSPAILLPDGTLWTVYHTDALREQRPEPEVEVNADEVEALRTRIVKGNWTTDEVDLTDERSSLIQDFADKKAEAGEFGQSEAPVLPERAPTAGNLLAALTASVQEAKAEQASKAV